MIKKTKGSIIVLALLLIISVFATACTSSKPNSSETSGEPTKAATEAPKEKINIRIMSRWTGTDANAPALQQLVKEFNEKNTDIQIIDESVADEQAYNNKLKTGVATGNMPHIFQQWTPYEYAKNGVLLDLKPYFDADKAWSDGFNPGLIDTVGKFNDLPGRYIMPMETGYEPFYYNTSLFEKAGIAKAPETFEELLADIKLLKAKGITPIAAGAKDTWRLGHIFNGIVYKRAGVDKAKGLSDGSSKFTDPEFVDSLKILKNMVEIGAFDKNMAGISYDTEKASFFAEKSAMVYNGTWFVGDCEASAIKDKIKVFFMPAMKDYPQFKDNDILYPYGWGLSNLVKNENEKNAMITVAKYLSGKEASALFTKICKRPPSRTDTGLDIKTISPILSEIVALGSTTITKSGGDVQDFYNKSKMTDITRNNLVGLVLGSKTVDEVAKIIQTEGTKD